MALANRVLPQGPLVPVEQAPPIGGAAHHHDRRGRRLVGIHEVARTGQREDFTTLGDSSTIAEFTIRCYWRMQASPDMRESIEAEMWDAIVGIKTALRADSNLSGNATDSRPGDASAGYIEIGGLVFRQVSIPFSVNIYGESPIVP